MVRKRPCRICRRWFQPEPRVGGRQHVCSSDECQRERHRRACSDWRGRTAEKRRERQLREKLRGADEKRDSGEAPGRGAHAARRELRLAEVRDAVSLEVYVILDEFLRHLERRLRDAVPAQAPAIPREFGRHPRPEGRDEIAGGRGPP